MFISALFTTDKTRKQPESPSQTIDLRMCGIYNIYTQDYYSVMKKNELPLAATWLDRKNTVLSELRERQIL